MTGSRLNPVKENSGFFYPVLYPKNFAGDESQFDVLLQSLKSLHLLSFSSVFLRIEIDNSTPEQLNLITKAVHEHINSDQIQLSFARPDSLRDWVADAVSVVKEIGCDQPLLVCLNHDHIFVEYNLHAFYSALDTVFSDKLFSGNRVLYYSHAPEVIASSLARPGFYDKSSSSPLLELPLISSWIDSLFIMTSGTFLHVWESIRNAPNYLGRFDWPGVKFDNLGLTSYAYGREFFRHFDGYGHVTGMRLLSQWNLYEYQSLASPAGLPAEEILEFYYSKWLALYLLSLKKCIQLPFPFSFVSVPFLYRAALKYWCGHSANFWFPPRFISNWITYMS